MKHRIFPSLFPWTGGLSIPGTRVNFLSWTAPLRAFSRVALGAVWLALGFALHSESPFHKAELIFPLEHWHNHGSCIVETPKGDLLVCWFNGSGERQADDVKIEGARLKRGKSTWSSRFTMADTPGYPDTNCSMFIDPEGRLWLLWPTILANKWESALMKDFVSSDYHRPGPPRWDRQEVLHVTPPDAFAASVEKYVAEMKIRYPSEPWAAENPERAARFLESLQTQAADKLTRRLGWMTRAHPFVLDRQRLIVPLYSDGFSFSMMAISDDWGRTWHTSAPLCGPGNIQPSIVQRRDGSLYTLMRDNGPPPKRLLQSESFDRGETWSPVTDSPHPNSGTGAEIIRLRNGHWVLINNDTERGRYSLAVSLSDDEGRTWKWKRHLEPVRPGDDRYHYPSIIQSRDGSLHASYSFHLDEAKIAPDASGKRAFKSIKHAHFNEAWIRLGD